MAISEHVGSRAERGETVASIPEHEWSFDAFLDLFLGLHDHGWQVCSYAKRKLLRMACCPDIKPIVLHPRDLASKYITPGTYEETFALVREMKRIGIAAKEICASFFWMLSGDSNRKMREALEILEGSELEDVAKPIVDKAIEARKAARRRQM